MATIIALSAARRARQGERDNARFPFGRLAGMALCLASAVFMISAIDWTVTHWL